MKLLWLALAVVRIGLVLNVFCPNWSYIQPDQFFQSTEPIAGDVFETQVLLVWEFNSSFPMRNIFFPQLIARPIFSLIKSLDMSDNPLIVFIGPRLVITFLSFICDYSIYKLCEYSDRSASMISSLVVFSSSYVSFTYLTQTFSNSIETILLSLLLVNVFKSISSRRFDSSNSLVIGSVLAFGFFNRPTFVLFASMPLLFWALSRTSEEDVTFKDLLKKLMIRCLSLLPSFVLTSMVLIIIDSLYYTENAFELMNDLTNYRFEEVFKNLVITPLNFAIYNTKASNLANHGLHPPYFHMLVSVPMAFSLLGLIAYQDFYAKTRDSLKSLFDTSLKAPLNVFQAISILTFVVPLLSFSLIPHQEPRFLIPSLIPLCYLYGHRLVRRKFLFTIWIVVNIFLTIFYGYIHQSAVIEGVIDLNRVIKERAHKPTDVVFSSHYLPPRHLLDIPRNSSDIRIHDLSVLGFPEPLDSKIDELKARKATDFYLMIPSCLSEQLEAIFTRHELNNNKLVKQYFPFFTGEEIESSLKLLTTSYQSLQKAFSLNIWRIYLEWF